jgi:hypothetical protein
VVEVEVQEAAARVARWVLRCVSVGGLDACRHACAHVVHARRPTATGSHTPTVGFGMGSRIQTTTKTLCNAHRGEAKQRYTVSVPVPLDGGIPLGPEGAQAVKQSSGQTAARLHTDRER